MSKLTCQSALLTCSQGLAPCALAVSTNQTVYVENKLAATVNDMTLINIQGFGTCKILTAAAQGIAQPCVPQIVTPWLPGGLKLTIQGQLALSNDSKAICSCGGQISITFSGQTTTTVS